jgi:hypothetical protein
MKSIFSYIETRAGFVKAQVSENVDERKLEKRKKENQSNGHYQ